MNPELDELEAVNILLVDDRPSNLLALHSVLAQPGYRLVEVNSGQEALNQVLRQDFAVILLDVAMPDMDGFETAAIIKQREHSRLIPIIFVTATLYDMEQVFRGYTVGAVDYLRKPVDPHQLRAKVAVFVELYRQKRQIQRQAAQLRDIELREQKQLRQEAEAALRESEAAYQLTFEEAPVGIGHAGADCGWLKVNARLRELIGAGPEDDVGGSVCEMGAGADSKALRRAFDRLNSREIALYTAEHSLRRRDGGRLWANIRIVPARAGTAAAPRYIVVIDDVSDRKQLELDRAQLVRELQEGIRMRDDFLTIAAHELKTPVTPLRLQTGSLLRSFEKHDELSRDEAQLQRRLQAIDKAADRLAALIDKLLDVSQISIGELVLQPEPVDLAALVGDVIDRVDGPANPSKITLEAPRTVIGLWDRVRLEQVFMNLIQNAVRYGAGKPIRISADAEDGAAWLSVRDQGVGIPPEAQARIFERFGRDASVHHFGGFGLGLWIVRQIVEAHDGRIGVQSRPGEGATFTVELPLRPRQAVDERAEPPLRELGGGEART